MQYSNNRDILMNEQSYKWDVLRKLSIYSLTICLRPPQNKVLHLNLKGSQGITMIFMSILEKYESSLLNAHHAKSSKLNSVYKL